MRVGDRARHLQEELEPLPQVAAARLHVFVDRPAVDVFHRDERPPTVGGACVVEPRDVRVLERRQRVALLHQPLGDAACPAGTRQLQRHLPLPFAIGALCEPDATHAAGAEFAQQPVRPDERTGSLDDAAVAGLEPLGRRRPAHEGIGFRAGALEHAAQPRQQRLVGVRARSEPVRARLGRQRQRLAQQLIQSPPVLGIGIRRHLLVPRNPAPDPDIHRQGGPSGRASPSAAGGRAPSRDAPCGR